VDVEDGVVSYKPEAGRAKPRHLDEDPWVALLVLDPNDPYRWVSVVGAAEITTQGANEQIDKLAKKYVGKDKYPWANPGRSG
jgi:Pyridoxamine 5'-phosphate oxidase